MNGQQGKMNSYQMPPNPIPGPFGNVSEIREGYSFRFNQKIPIDMYDLYGEGGFDQIQAKYEIASLQLQNIETMKTLQEKDREYQGLFTDMEELRDQLKKSLLVQDELFKQHFDEVNRLKQQAETADKAKQNFSDECNMLKVQVEQYKDFAKTIESNNRETLEGKLAALTQKSALLDINLIK